MNPKVDMSELAQAAVQLNEMYLTLQCAGFTKEEALHLVGQILTNVQPGCGA